MPDKVPRSRNQVAQRRQRNRRTAAFERKPGMTSQKIGITGLKVMSGRINEEYLTMLRSWDKESKVFIEMRDDIIVGTLLEALKLPLIAAEFSVEPASDYLPADKAAAEWLDKNLYNMNRQSWRSYVLDALEAIDFGFAVGEIILEKRGDGRMWLKNIDPRGQETLDRWTFDDDGSAEEFIQRDSNTNKIIEIPLSKCVHITFRGRKGNPQGRSLLRSLYRTWRMAKDLENLEAVGVERDVGGMPVAKLPAEGHISETDRDTLKAALKAMRQDEASYAIMPPGVELNPYGGGSKMYDVGAIIDRKHKEILGRAFAQFLKLGMDNVGTQALVKGSQDFFALGLESIQGFIVEALNQQLVPYLFYFNSFPGMTDYPKIKWEAPGKVDLSGLITSLNSAIGAKLYTPTDVDEEHIRMLADMPDLPEDEKGMPRQTEEPPMEGIFTPVKKNA